MQNNSLHPLTYRQIMSLWFPLLGSWLLIAFEAPWFNQTISHMTSSQLELAAFNIIYSFYTLAEAPLLMLNMLTMRYIYNAQTLIQVRYFVFSFSAVIFLLMTLFLYGGLFDWVSKTKMHLQENIVHLARQGLSIVLPAYFLFGYRRFVHGILVSAKQSQLVLYSLCARVVFTVVITYLLRTFTQLTVIPLVSTAILGTLLFEAVFARCLAQGIFLKLRQITQNGRLSYRALVRFYYPLMMAGIISLVISPLVTFFLSAAPNAIISLATYAVVQSVIFVFRAAAMSLQEVIVVYLSKNWSNLRQLKQFTFYVGGAILSLLVLLVLTPAYDLLFAKIFNLDLYLVHFTKTPFIMLVFYPLLTLVVIWQRALLIVQHTTSIITWASIIEVLFLVFALYLSIQIMGYSAIIATSVVLLLGRVVALMILSSRSVTSLLPVDKLVVS